MRLIPAEKPYHAIVVDGDVVDVGDGDAGPQGGQSVLWFDSIADRETNQLVKDWRRKQVKRKRLAIVEDMKSPEEYQGKEENAARWIRNNPQGMANLTSANVTHTHGDYTDDDYRWMSLEVIEKGITPRNAAIEITDAVKRTDEADMGSWVKAKKRVKLRELLRE